MRKIIDFIIRCKKKCSSVLSSLDDSHNFETAVDTLMNEVSSTPPIEVKIVNFAQQQESPLYSAPSEEYQTATKGNRAEEILDGLKIDKELIEPINVVELAIEESVPSKKSSPKVQTSANNEHLVSAFAMLVEELDNLSQETSDTNILSTVEFIQNRIIEILLKHGCTPIDRDMAFDPTAHVTKPFRLFIDESEIASYIRVGVRFEGKVLIKAVVRVKE